VAGKAGQQGCLPHTPPAGDHNELCLRGAVALLQNGQFLLAIEKLFHRRLLDRKVPARS